MIAAERNDIPPYLVLKKNLYSATPTREKGVSHH